MKYITMVIIIALLLSCKAEDIFADRISHRTGIIHTVCDNPIMSLVLISEIPITYVLDAEETLFEELIQLEGEIVTTYFNPNDADYAYHNKYMKIYVVRYKIGAINDNGLI